MENFIFCTVATPLCKDFTDIMTEAVSWDPLRQKVGFQKRVPFKDFF